MNLYALSVTCFGITSLLIGLLVWIKLESKVGFYYFLFSAFAGLWGMFEGQQFSNNFDYSTSVFFAKCSNVSAIFIGPFWYHFALAFERKEYSLSQKATLFIFYLAAIFICSFSSSRLFVAGVHEIVGIKYYTKPGPIWHIFTVLFFASIPFGFKELFRHLSKLAGKERGQCWWLICTTGVGFLGGALTFPPAYGIPLPQYGLLIMPLYPLFMAISMMKYGLLTEENLILAAHKDKLAALGVLTASMNHEIRSPLFLMRGMIEIEGKGSPLGIKLLNQINRVTDIVARLTHFAKKGVEETAQIEPLNLNEVLEDIRPLFQHQLNYQHIEYNQEVPKDLPKVMADRRYLEEILFNLILNACQALQNTSQPTIELSARILEDQRLSTSDHRLASRSSGLGSTIVVTIVDNGPGFTDKQRKNVFKPFYTTKEEGTGLGLYITKQLVEKCGGKIEIRSSAANGTQFVVKLLL